ncbi:hypothetical protein B005_2634 [Nocardiopsis alba ATCC BAA-2165]|uniref:Uncharacterized protein n=1 Tax=Nocardiopsis alba (strain ATCC BAA-2165 / BE74) TaxID=1205910 RepID=J7LI92_NOCAA|nr:hypothetical protein B005_2634 [Nocardiopsis alba ATCC BAA-2165]
MAHTPRPERTRSRPGRIGRTSHVDEIHFADTRSRPAAHTTLTRLPRITLEKPS